MPKFPRREPQPLHPLVEELIRRRRERKLTYEDLTRLSELPPTTLSAYEHGHSQPTVGRLARWATALGLEVHLVDPAVETVIETVKLATVASVSPRRAAELAAIAKFERERGITAIPAFNTPEFEALNERHPLGFDHRRQLATRRTLTAAEGPKRGLGKHRTGARHR